LINVALSMIKREDNLTMPSFQDKIIARYLENNKESLPKILYHYTTSEGLLGILNTKRIWATNINYLNDSEELNRTLELLERSVKIRLKKVVKDLLVPLEIIKNEIDIYVISFTKEKGDLLSQWRGYCPSSGFSIGFDYSGLRNLFRKEIESEDYFLLPCFYNDLDHKFFISLLIEDTIEVLKAPSESDIREVVSKHIDRVVLIASILKDKSFSEEKEWRLFCIRKKNDQSQDIKFRKGKSTIIPYIELSIENRYGVVPIKEIIVGPTPLMDLSVNSIKKFLSSKNIDCNPIESKIPFRNW